MQTGTPESGEITLYQCYKCGRGRYQDEIDAGAKCPRCASMHVSRAPYTFRFVAAFLLRHPRLIRRYFREDFSRDVRDWWGPANAA